MPSLHKIPIKFTIIYILPFLSMKSDPFLPTPAAPRCQFKEKKIMSNFLIIELLTINNFTAYSAARRRSYLTIREKRGRGDS